MQNLLRAHVDCTECSGHRLTAYVDLLECNAALLYDIFQLPNSGGQINVITKVSGQLLIYSVYNVVHVVVHGNLVTNANP